MKKIIYSVVAIIMFLVFGSTVMAAGYTISLSSSSVTKGRSVTLYIRCSDATGGFSISSSNSNVASLSSSTVWCENNTESVGISTTTTGSATITVKPLSVADGSGNDLSLGAKSLTLSVTEPVVVKKSTDANLSSLEVEEGTLSPEFKKDTLEYTVELPAETTKINIKAKASDSKASVKGTGEREVSDGSNKLEVVVTAEDGTVKTYVINANVKELDPITVKVDKKEYSVVRKKADLPEMELFEATTVKIGDEEVVAYHNDKLKIDLVGLKDKDGKVNLYIYDSKNKKYTLYNQITVGSTTIYLKDSKAPNSNYKEYMETLMDNLSVSVYKLSKDSKLTLLYGVNVLTGNEGYYVYDKEEKTLQRYNNDEVVIYKDKADNYFTYLVISIGVIGVIFIILLIRFIVKTRKNKKYKTK